MQRTRLNRCFDLMLLVCTGLAVVACGQSERRLPAEKTQKRIVSLDPSVTALIKAFGREDWLVGVTRHCSPVKGAVIVGDMRPDLARIIAAKPDLIFSGLYTYNKDALESIRSMKLPLMQFPLLTLHDLRQAAKSIANALDTPQSAQSFQKRLDTAIKGAKAQRPDKAPRVLLVYATDAGYIFTTGGGDLLSEIVVLVGGKNAAEGGPATRRLSLGQVLALSPDMIVHVASDRRFKHDRHARDYWRKVGTFPAVVHNRIYVWTDDRLSRMGPQVPDAIKKMAHLVQGDAS